MHICGISYPFFIQLPIEWASVLPEYRPTHPSIDCPWPTASRCSDKESWRWSQRNRHVPLVVSHSSRIHRAGRSRILIRHFWQGRRQRVPSRHREYFVSSLSLPFAQPSLCTLSPSVFRLAVVRQFLPFLVKLGSSSLRRFVLELMPSEALQAVKDIVDTMHRTSVEVFESKKRALAAGDQALKEQVGEGKDLMSVLCK